jgi:outer membrane lipoprotein-sorting protein
MRSHFVTIIPILSLLSVASAVAQDTSLPEVNEVVAQMVARDAQRQLWLEGYGGMRRYTLVNEHMHKRAEMMVRVSGDPDGKRHFEVVEETGWKAAQKHVLQKMLESEAEASVPEVRVRTRLSTDNYKFQMAGIESTGDRMAYAIDVTPKRRDKYLFQGRIWVDTEEFALLRAEGNPAKNPSFWTKSVHFVHTYQKNGVFWFPLSTESITEARLFGTTDLTIDYFDYRPNSPSVPGTYIEMAQRGTRP